MIILHFKYYYDALINYNDKNLYKFIIFMVLYKYL